MPALNAASQCGSNSMKTWRVAKIHLPRCCNDMSNMPTTSVFGSSMMYGTSCCTARAEASPSFGPPPKTPPVLVA